VSAQEHLPRDWMKRSDDSPGRPGRQ